jgi:hypothetical protein
MTTKAPTTIAVEKVGTPIACSEGVRNSWREVAAWVAGQLGNRYGDAVSVRYYDLFDADCPPLPPDAQLPLVLIQGEVLSSGGKISVPLIKARLSALGPVALDDQP